MIDACFLVSNGERVGFRISGHARYSESGTDIVCSAVSALAQTTVNSLTDIVGINPQYSINDSGVMFCRIKPSHNEKQNEYARLLLDTLHIGLVGIEQEYGKYLRLSEREVTNNV